MSRAIRLWRQVARAADVDGADILIATGIAAIAVWVGDAFGWPAAVGATGVCLLSLGLGGVLIGRPRAGR